MIVVVWPLAASVLIGMAVWFWPNHKSIGRVSRIRSVTGTGVSYENCVQGLPGRHETSETHKPSEPSELFETAGVNKPPGGRLPPIGGVACVSALQASVKSGSTLVGAFEELAGMPFATAELTAFRVRLVVRGRSLPEERCEQADLLSEELYAACRLSAELGCETSHCLEVVASSLKRRCLMDDLRANAFAMPQATVKLLLALPLVTLLLGEGIGARPLSFLFGDSKGLLCLGFAACCYALGLLWVRALMRKGNHD